MQIEPSGNRPHERLLLPEVTLIAAASVNVTATLKALAVSIEKVRFAECKLFTDVEILTGTEEIDVVKIKRLKSSKEYSNFILSDLVDYINTPFCLVVQWDGHVIDASRWSNEFLDYDYIGASWPQFDDPYRVGNGGFSLRSRALMEACRHANFIPLHPEDVAICRVNRLFLESKGLHFPPYNIADLFSAERSGDTREVFGYHGVFNMPMVLGVDNFWDIYATLDDKSTLRRDFWDIFRSVWRGSRHRFRRCIKMLKDRLFGG